MRQALGPAGTPIGAEHSIHFCAEALLDGLDCGSNVVVVLQCLEVAVEVTWLGRAAAEGVHLRAIQAVKRIELHGVQGDAEVGELRWRGVEFAAFIVGADDEHAHVARGSGLHGGPVEVVDEIPVEIYVIKCVALNGFHDDIGGGVCGESDMPAAALLLQPTRGGHAALLTE